MTKRPDQHNLDAGEAGATDYKWRRKTEEKARRDSPDELPANQATTETPNEAMQSRREQSEEDRADELERARQGGDSDADRVEEEGAA